MSQRKPESAKAPAIQPLAVLPVFYDLHGRTVLLAGDGAASSCKLELLLGAGARVVLATQTLPADAAAVAAAYPSRVTHRTRRWVDGDFAAAVMAIGVFGAADERDAFACAARAARVPVHLAGDAAASDFGFGTIVNRSPVVVSIFAAGAAPALARMICQRIEALLPPTLADWGRAAVAAREEIAERLPDRAARGMFWRRFAEAAFVRPTSDIAAFIASRNALSTRQAGSVTLVGAGPGAEDLLTIRAVRAMQNADVILFDDLVADGVLDLARREAKRMLVGKRGHRASCRQEDINALMIKLAGQGKRVVRLKSGDPMIFGRAGEELEALRAEGIVCDVVPGVTAALAAASCLGVSLTHRDHAQGLKFITAHSREGRLPELDWRACADPRTTLIAYMGGRTAGAMAGRLMDEGLSARTPVSIIENASRDDQSVAQSTLGDLAAHPIERPGAVLIGVGTVFGHAQAMATANAA